MNLKDFAIAPYFWGDNKVIQKSVLTYTEKSFKSALMRSILDKALELAKHDMPIILIGEIGTEKKRIGQIIHENSSRAPYPFYSFYCLSVTNEEYEEAFREQLHLNDDHFVLKYNVIEKALKGTLYLDKFSELPADLMLNVIQSFIKGSEQLFRYSKEAKPRLLLSVNMESYAELINTPVWQTILHSLNPQVIMVPPLRKRKEDIPLLVDSYIRELKSKTMKYSELLISDDALKACSSYNWPGNITQLRNALMQGVVLSNGKTIESNHLPFSMSWKLPYEVDENNY